MFIAATTVLVDQRNGHQLSFKDWADSAASVARQHRQRHPLRFGRQMILDFVRLGVLRVASGQ